MDIPAEEQPAYVLNVIRKWPWPAQLAEFAVRRHGFADTDGGFGVTYPDDLDDYERATGGHIPEAFLEIWGFWGSPEGDEFHFSERRYLEILAAYLEDLGLKTDSASVAAIACRTPTPTSG